MGLKKITTDKDNLINDAEAMLKRVIDFKPEEVICVFIKEGRVFFRCSKTNDFLAQLGALEYAKNKIVEGL